MKFATVINQLHCLGHRLTKSHALSVIVGALVVGSVFTLWSVRRTDRAMRDQLLSHAALVAQVVSIEDIKSLTGTRSDLGTPAYLRLKEQLESAKQSEDRCRFIYIMGRRPEGDVFFYADSEPIGSADESPAGQVYPEAPPGFLRSFLKKTALTIGPFTDRWGTWVTASTPLTDPVTGDCVAVLGVDVDARVWAWDIASGAAVPIASVWVLLTVIGAGFVVTYAPEKRSVKPVQRRLLIPLGAVMFLLVTCSGAVLLSLQRASLKQPSIGVLSSASKALDIRIQEQVRALSAVEWSLSQDPALISLLKAKDRDGLTQRFQHVFGRLRNVCSVNHISFALPDRMVLLRAEKPEECDHVVNRFTVLEAERTRKIASGIEANEAGQLALHVVCPVISDDELVGFVELGRDLAPTLDVLAEEHDVELAVTIRRSLLNRDAWAADHPTLDRGGDWTRFSDEVLVHSTVPVFPAECDGFVENSDHVDYDVTKEVVFDRRSWHLSFAPLDDASGTTIGNLILLHDITQAVAQFDHLMTVVSASAAVLLTALLSCLYVALRRVDRCIGEQQNQLQRSKNRIDSLCEQGRAVIWEVDADGLYTYISHVAEQVLGYRREELVGRLHIYDLHPEDGRDKFKAVVLDKFAKRESFVDLENPKETKFGDIVWMSSNGMAKLDADGELIGYHGSDADVSRRKEAEMAASSRSVELERQAIKLEQSRRVALRMMEAAQNALQSAEKAHDLLAKSDKTFMDSFYASADATLLFEDGKIVDCNERTIEMLGASSKEQILGKTPHDVSPEHQSDGRASADVIPHMAEIALERGSHRFEWEQQRLDGSRFPTEVTLVPVSLFGKQLFYCVWKDISELLHTRAAAEQAQRDTLIALETTEKLLDAMPIGVLVVGRDRKIRRVNQAALDMIGGALTVDELVGATCHQRVCPAREGECPVWDCGQQVVNAERELIRADGGRVSILKTIVPMTLGGEDVLLGAFVDISERKKTEEELAKAHRALQNIMDASSQVSIIATDPSGFITLFNRGAEIMIGYSAEELVGNRTPAAFHLHSELISRQKELSEEYGHAVEGFDVFTLKPREEGSERREWTYVRKDGSHLTVNLTVTVVRDNAGEIVGYLGIALDVTEQRQAEEALKHSETRFRDVALASSDWIWEVDAEGRYTFATEKVKEVLGYSVEEVLGKTPFDLIAHDDVERVKEAFYALAKNKQPIRHLENWNTTKDGRRICLLTNGTPILDADGNLAGYRGVDTDITEQKNVEESLRENNAMLAEALKRRQAITVQLEAAMGQLKAATLDAEAATRSKSEFLANMSHEIRTPMTAILGFTETLLDPNQSDSERLSAVRIIRRNGEHLLQIINDILDISKIEAGRMEIESIRCSAVEVVAEVLSLMQVRADAKNLPFNVEYIGAIPVTIESDPTRLKQILVNLIGNAIKFTETGGVRLIVRLVGGDTDPNPEHDRPVLQFDVIDTGIGMTAQHVEKLFRPFSQADTSTTRKFGGTGLGLNISKRLAQMLGGDITVQSEHGQGSMFRLTVSTGSLDGVKMLDDPAEATIAKPESSAKVHHAQQDEPLECRILLAEDGPDNQRLISHVLRRAGAEVTIVENGKLALDEALSAQEQGRAYDIILMDMQMPVSDGYEATSNLRRKGYTKPIIALTAHAMASDRDKCLGAGCDDYTTKPIDRPKLIDLIRKYLSQRRDGEHREMVSATAEEMS